jgi:hypothetical protein
MWGLGTTHVEKGASVRVPALATFEGDTVVCGRWHDKPAYPWTKSATSPLSQMEGDATLSAEKFRDRWLEKSTWPTVVLIINIFFAGDVALRPVGTSGRVAR